jgi:hypothetical protein
MELQLEKPQTIIEREILSPPLEIDLSELREKPALIQVTQEKPKRRFLEEDGRFRQRSYELAPDPVWVHPADEKTEEQKLKPVYSMPPGTHRLRLRNGLERFIQFWKNLRLRMRSKQRQRFIEQKTNFGSWEMAAELDTSSEDEITPHSPDFESSVIGILSQGFTLENLLREGPLNASTLLDRLHKEEVTVGQLIKQQCYPADLSLFVKTFDQLVDLGLTKNHLGLRGWSMEEVGKAFRRQPYEIAKNLSMYPDDLFASGISLEEQSKMNVTAYDIFSLDNPWKLLNASEMSLLEFMHAFRVNPESFFKPNGKPIFTKAQIRVLRESGRWTYEDMKKCFTPVQMESLGITKQPILLTRQRIEEVLSHP